MVLSSGIADMGISVASWICWPRRWGEAGAAVEDLAQVAVGDANALGEVLELPAAADDFGFELV